MLDYEVLHAIFALLCKPHQSFPRVFPAEMRNGPDLLTGIKEYLGAVRNPTYINIIQAEKLS